MIHTSFSPNTQKDDLSLTLKTLLFLPSSTALSILSAQFKKKFGFKHVFLFNSGRSAYTVLLQALAFSSQSQIATQAFTCHASINPILWNHLEPLYIDIDSSFNLDPQDLAQKINSQVKAVIVQHTFGYPANLKKILPLVKRHKLILIEDCAHSLGVKYENKYCGTFSTASYFSLGRDKVISSVYGGILATNNQSLAQKIEKIYQNLPFPPPFWTLKQLTHPLLFALTLPFYNFLDLGKAFLFILRKLGLSSVAIHPLENRGQRPSYFPARLPPQLAVLARHQLKKLSLYQKHRVQISNLYQKSFPQNSRQRNNPSSQPIPLKFSLITPSAPKISQDLKKQDIYLQNWYQRVIDPPGAKLSTFQYQIGTCPQAEKLAGKVLSLPTHIGISPQKAQTLIQIIKKHLP